MLMVVAIVAVAVAAVVVDIVVAVVVVDCCTYNYLRIRKYYLRDNFEL